MMGREPLCPMCGAEGKGHNGEHEPAIIQGKGTFYDLPANIILMGWRCWKCGHEWGFEFEPEKE
jgi:hypothetical protein